MIDIRQATPDDLRFVRDSWFESYRRGGFAPEIGFDLFSEGQRRLIDHLTDVEDRPAIIRVAYALNAPDEILGWICWEHATDGNQQVLHYVYVKNAYRKMGIAEGLIDRAKNSHGFKFYSHQTRAGIQLAKKYGFRYNPYFTMKGNP